MELWLLTVLNHAAPLICSFAALSKCFLSLSFSLCVHEFYFKFKLHNRKTSPIDRKIYILLTRGLVIKGRKFRFDYFGFSCVACSLLGRENLGSVRIVKVLWSLNYITAVKANWTRRQLNRHYNMRSTKNFSFAEWSERVSEWMNERTKLIVSKQKFWQL